KKQSKELNELNTLFTVKLKLHVTKTGLSFIGSPIFIRVGSIEKPNHLKKYARNNLILLIVFISK
ncbi:MAG: hypothetical protein ACTSWY_13175, partial [Promethearchaeota archaeon]